MADWDAKLVECTKSAVKGYPFWEKYLRETIGDFQNGRSLHLAIFVEPYLRFILEGRKTVESRFSSRLYPPHKSVQKGDVLLLKKSGGAVVGLCRISHVWFYRLDPKSWKSIKKDFAKAICAQGSGFWDDREGASFATLMRITNVARIEPIACEKCDRRGWVVLQNGCDNHVLI